jgi:hypothetical protein
MGVVDAEILLEDGLECVIVVNGESEESGESENKRRGEKAERRS